MKLSITSCIAFVTMVIAAALVVEGIPFRAPYRTKNGNVVVDNSPTLPAEYIRLLRRLLAAKYQKIAAIKREAYAKQPVVSRSAIDAAIMNELRHSESEDGFARREIDNVRYFLDEQHR